MAGGTPLPRPGPSSIGDFLITTATLAPPGYTPAPRPATAPARIVAATVTPAPALAAAVPALLAMGQRRGLAAATLVRALAVHPGTLTSAGHVLELCPAYLVAMSGGAFSRTTARHLWALFVASEVFVEIGVDEARALGARVRDLEEGERHGRFVVVAPSTRDYLATLLDAESLPMFLGGEDWQVVPDQSDLSRVVPGPRGVGRPCKTRCPFHADSHPSASIWLNADGVSGGGTCYACEREGGGRLTFYLRVDEAGLWWARRSGERQSREGGHDVPEGVPENAGSTVGATDQNPQGVGGGVSWALPRVEGTSMRPLRDDTSKDTVATMRLDDGPRSGLYSLRYAAGDLGAVMRRADRRSQWAKIQAHAEEVVARAARQGRQPELANQLFAVSQSAPVYREMVQRGMLAYRIAGFRAVGQRWVLIDMDGDGPVSDDAAEAVRAEVAWIAGSDPWLSGASTIVRTSDRGVQVCLELACEVRGDLDAWWRDGAVRSWYAGIAARLSVASGGALRVDMSAAAPGRLGRRPGWRVTKAGGLFRARLIGWTARSGDLAA